jgi:hypothetical protein
MAVMVGEFGARDYGNNTAISEDTTVWMESDKDWFASTAAYLRRTAQAAGQGFSWMFWCWNANSGDTQGLVGSHDTWREVQWTKVCMLVREFSLRSWYCSAAPAFCDSVEWRN